MARRRRNRRGQHKAGSLTAILEPDPDPDPEAIDRAYAMIFNHRPGFKVEEHEASKQDKQQRLF